MTLIELISTVCRRLGFTEPNSVIGSGDKNIRQLSALLSQLGSDLVTQYDWRRLYREHLLTTRAVDMTASMTKGSRTLTVADASLLDSKWMAVGAGMPPFNGVDESTGSTVVRMKQPAAETGSFDLTFHQVAYPLPSDWHRQVPQTEYGRISPVAGPKNAQDWQRYKSGVVYPGATEMFRLMGSAFHIMPPPPDGLTFSFEYISKNWIMDALEDTGKDLFTNDQDTFVFSDSVLMTGLVARWFDVHGLDSTIEKRELAALLGIAKAQDKSAAVLSLSPRTTAAYLSSRSIPEGNWEL